MEATRGVVFILKAKTDGSVGEQFNELSQRATALQAMLSDVRLGGIDLTAFGADVDKAHQKLDALTAKANGAPVAQAGVSPSMPPAPSSNGSTPVRPPVSPSATAVEHAEQSTAAEIDAAKSVTAAMQVETEKQAALPEKVIRNRIRLLARIQQAEQTARERETAAVEKAAAAHQTALDKEMAADKKYWESFGVFGEKSQAKRQAAEAKAAADAEKLRQKQQTALEKEQEADKKYWDNFVSYGEKSQAKREKDEERAAAQVEAEQEKATAAHERASRKVFEINNRLRGSLLEVADGSTELARGFVEAGLIGEEDFNKVKDSLLAVQSAMDLVRGGLGIWHSLSEAAHLYGERLETIEKAEKLAAAAAAARAAVQGGAAATGDAAAMEAERGGGKAAGGFAGVLGVEALGAPIALWAAAATSVFAAGKVISEAFRDVKGPVDDFGMSMKGLSHKVVEGESGFTNAVHGFVKDNLGEWMANHFAAKDGSITTGIAAVTRSEWRRGNGTDTTGASEWSETVEREKAVRKQELEARASYLHNLTEQFSREEEARQRDVKIEDARRGADVLFGGVRTALEAEANQKNLHGQDRQQFVTDKSQLQEIDVKIADAEAAASAARKHLQSLENTPQVFATDADQGAYNDARKSAVDAETNAGLELVSLAKQQASIKSQMHQRELSALGKELELQQQQVVKAKALAAQLKTAMDDALAGFDEMTPVEQAMLIKLREVVDAGGELTHDQEQLVKRGGDEKMKAYVRQRQINRAQDLLGTRHSRMFAEETERRDNAQRNIVTQEAMRDQKQAELQRAGASNIKIEQSGTVTFDVNINSPQMQRIAKELRTEIEPILRRLMGPELKATIKNIVDTEISRSSQRFQQTRNAKT